MLYFSQPAEAALSDGTCKTARPGPPRTRLLYNNNDNKKNNHMITCTNDSVTDDCIL